MPFMDNEVWNYKFSNLSESCNYQNKYEVYSRNIFQNCQKKAQFRDSEKPG